MRLNFLKKIKLLLPIIFLAVVFGWSGNPFFVTLAQDDVQGTGVVSLEVQSLGQDAGQPQDQPQNQADSNPLPINSDMTVSGLMPQDNSATLFPLSPEGASASRQNDVPASLPGEPVSNAASQTDSVQDKPAVEKSEQLAAPAQEKNDLPAAALKAGKTSRFEMVTKSLKIFPETLNDYTTGWQNPGAALSQSLSETASPPEFDENNSAYLKIDDLEAGDTETITLAKFGAGRDISWQKIQSVNLRVSVAVLSTASAGRITAEFQSGADNNYSWVPLGAIDSGKEISNAANGGFFAFSAPIPNNLNDLENAKIRLAYTPLGGGTGKIFLDAFWLEAVYQTEEIFIVPAALDVLSIGSMANATTTIDDAPAGDLPASFPTVSKILPQNFEALPDGVNSAWTNPLAALTRDLDDTAKLEDFNPGNSAVLDLAWTGNQMLVFDGFAANAGDAGKSIENLQVFLSLAAQPQYSDSSLITVEYKSGETWTAAGTIPIGAEISGATNGGFFHFPLPLPADDNDLANTAVRLSYSPDGLASGQAYLDGLWLEATYSNVVSKSDNNKDSAKKIFKKGEAPTFVFPEIEDKRNFIQRIIQAILNQKRQVAATLVDPTGKENTDGITIQGNTVSISETTHKYRPGRYTLKLTIKNGKDEMTEDRQFDWGVLTVNVDKSIYRVGDTARIDLGVLDNSGHTICDAQVQLAVTDPDGNVSYPQVIPSGQCARDNITDVPDYSATYAVAANGTYRLDVSAATNSGTKEITDSFSVDDSVPFDAQRDGPTRINPTAPYQMKLMVKASADYRGEVIETVPAGFDISEITGGGIDVSSAVPDPAVLDINSSTEGSSASSTAAEAESGADATLTETFAPAEPAVAVNGDVKTITWQVDWKAGETHELGYKLKAPNISPYIFLLGPLVIGDFSETRQWQIASDSTAMIIQPILGAYSGNMGVDSATPQYNMLMGGYAWNATASQVNEVIPTAGKLRKLYVRLSGDPTNAGSSYTFAVIVNGSASTLTCAVAAGATTCNDVSHELTLAAGDYVSLNVVASATDPVAVAASWSTEFESDTAGESIVMGNSITTASVTDYMPLAGNYKNGTESYEQIPMPTAGTFKNLYVKLGSNIGTAPDDYVIALRVGGSTVNNSVTITAPNTTGNDTAHTDAVNAADLVNFIVTPENGPTFSVRCGWGIVFAPTNDGESLILGGSYDTPSTGSAEYFHLGGYSDEVWNGTEASMYSVLPDSFTLKNLYVKLTTGPGTNKHYVISVNSPGGSATGLTVDITGSTGTTGSDTAHTYVAATGDTASVKSTPSGTPNSTRVKFGVVAYAVAICTSQGGGGDWDNAAKWDCGHEPAAHDAVVIANGHNMTVNKDTNTISDLTINSGATLNTDASARTITLSGNWTNNGGTFTAGSSTVIFAGTSQTIGGSGSTAFNNLTTSGSSNTSIGYTTTVGGNLSVGTGTVLTMGNYAFTVTGTSSITGTLNTATGNTGTRTFTGAVTVNSGGVWNFSGQNPATSFGGGITMSGTTFNNGSGAAAFTADQSLLGAGDMTFGGDVTPAASTTLTNSNSGTVTIAGTLTLTGNFTQGSNSPTLTLSAATPLSGAGTFDASSHANAVNYTYSGAQTINPIAYHTLGLGGSGAKTMTSITAIGGDFNMSGSATATTVITTIGGNVNISGTAVWTNGAANVVTGSLTVGAGAKLTMGNYALTIGSTSSITGTVDTATGGTGTRTFTGMVTVNSGGSWNLSGQDPDTSFGGGITNNSATNFTNGSGAATFTANQSLLGTGAMYFTGDVTVAGGTTLTNSNSATVYIYGTLTLTGNFTQGSNSPTLDLSGDTIGGAGTFNASTNANTVNYTGFAQTVKPVAYKTLGLGGSNTKTMTGVTTIGADFNMSDHATASTEITTIGGNVNLSGSANWINGAANVVSGSLTVGGFSELTMGNYALTIGSTTSVTGTVDTAYGATGTRTFTGAVTVNYAGVWNLSGQNPATSFGAGINSVSGTTFNNGSGAAAFTANQSLQGSDNMIFGSVTPAIGTTLTNSNSATVTIAGTLTLTGNFTQGSNSPTLKFSGATPLSGAGTFNTWTNANTVNFSSSSAQNIPAQNFYNLTSSSSGARTLASSGTIGVAGAFTPGSNSYTVTGSTISFNGSGAQNIPAWDYFNNLSTATSGTKALAGKIIVAADLSVGSGTVLNLGSVTTHTANQLFLAGSQQASGTWGSTGSSATNKDDTYFTAASSGYVTVATGNCVTGTWTGASSTDWNTAANWCGGVPSASTDVDIPAGGNQPTIGAAGGLCRNITIESGATLTISSTYSLTVSGNWTNNGGTLTANSSTVTFNGASKTIGGSGSTAFNNLSTSSSATVTTAHAITIGGNLSIADGTTFTAAGYDLTVTGTTTVGGGTSGSLVISSATGTKTLTGNVTIAAGSTWNNSGNSDISFGGSLAVNGGSLTWGSGTHYFTGTGKSITSSGSGITVTIPTVSISGSLTNSLSGINILSISTALSGVGSLTQDTSASLNLGGTSGITTLTATATSNTVNYSGAGQTAHSGNYYNLSLSGSGTDVLQTGTTAIGGNLALSGTVSTATVVGLTVSGNLSIGDGTTFTAAGYDLTITGTATVGGGASGSLVISSSSGTKIFTGLVTMAAGATWNNSGNSDVTFRGGLTNGGTFTSGSGVYTFNTNNQNINCDQAVSIDNLTVTGVTLTNQCSSNWLTVVTALSGSGTLAQDTSALLKISGSSAITGLNASAGTNQVVYNGTTQTVHGNNYYTLYLTGGAKTLQSGTTAIGGNLYVQGSGTATTVVGLAISGNLTVNTSNGSGGQLTIAGYDFSVDGSTTIGSSSVASSLTINNSSGTKTFTGNVTITAGSTWNNSGNSDVYFGGSLAMNDGSFSAGSGTHYFTGTSKSITSSGSGITLTIPIVSISGSLTNSLSGSNILSITSALSGAGSLTQDTNANLYLGGTSGITTLTASASGNTVVFIKFGAQTIPSTTYNNLACSGGSSPKILGGNVTINGNLSIGNSTYLDLGTYTADRATSGGTLTLNTAAGLKIGGTNSFPTNYSTNTLDAASTVEYYGGTGSQTIAAQNYGNLTSSGAGARVLASSGTIGIAGTFTPGSNSYTITSSTIDFNGSGSQSIPAFNYNNLTSSSSGARTLASSGTIGIAGAFTPGSNTYTVTGSTISFNGSGAQNIPAWDYYNNLSTATSGTKALAGKIIVAADLSVGSGTVLNLGSVTTHTANQLYLGGNAQISGTWGSTGSSATNKNDTYFTAASSGYVTVVGGCTSGTWTGASSTDWNTAGNWCGGVPTASTDVDIPAGGNQPAIGAAGGLCRNITIESGATLTISSTYSLTVSGNWTNNGGTLTANSSTVTFDGSSKTIGGSGSTAFNNLSTSSSATVTTAHAITIGGNLVIANGTTFTAAGYDLTVTGTTTVGGGTSGSLVISSSSGTKIFTGLVTIAANATWNNSGNSAITFRGGITNNSNSFSGGSGVQTFDTNNQDITSSILTSISNLTITGVTVTNKSVGFGLLNDGSLSGTGGLTQDTDAILIINGTSNIATLTATSSGNTVVYEGTTQTIHSNNYYNLSIGGGAKTLQTGTTAIGGDLTVYGFATTATVAGLTVSGNLSIGDYCTFTAAGYDLTVTGTTTVGGGTSGSLVISSSSGTKIFTGLVTIAANATWNNSGDSDATFRGGITNSGTFTAGSGVQTFDVNNQTVTCSAAAITIPNMTVNTIIVLNSCTGIYQLTVSAALSGTGALRNGVNANLSISGTSAITTLDALTYGGNTVNYNGAGQTVHTNSYINLILSGSGTKTLFTGSGSIYGNLTLSGTASATTVKNTSIGGNLSIGDGTTFTAAGYDLTVSGTTTVGNGTSGSLVISSATGTKTLTGNVTIAAGSTWNNSGNSDVSFGGSLAVNGGTQTWGSGTHYFTGTGKSITSSGSGITVAIPTVSVSGSLTNSLSGLNVLSITSALSGAGSLPQGSNANLYLGGTSGITTLTASASGNTVNYNGSGSQDVKVITYNNLYTSTSGTKTLIGSVTVNSDLNIGGSSTLDLATYTADRATSGGTLTVASGATLKIGGTNSFPTNYSTNTLDAASTVEYYGGTQTIAALTYGNLNIKPGSNSITDTLASGTITVQGNLVAGNGTNTGAVVTAATNDPDISVAGNFTVSGNTTFTNSDDTSKTLNIDGKLTITGTFTAPAGTTATSFTLGGDFENNGTFNNNSGRITFDGNGGANNQTLSGTTATTTFYKIYITAGGTRTVYFTDGNHYAVASGGAFNLAGTSSYELTVTRAGSSAAWYLDVDNAATVGVSYVTASWSNASGGQEIDASNGTNTNGNNNTNWKFISNTAPEFDSGYEPHEDPVSSSGSPTNVGANVTFKAQATDAQSNQWYLAICKENSISANSNAAPTCGGTGAWVVSSTAANSGTGITLTYQVQAGDTLESYDWYAFACDKTASNPACSAMSNGGTITGSGTPFGVNHAPSFTSISTGATSPALPGQDVTFSSSGAADSDTSATISLYVCSSSYFSNGCDSGKTWCSALNGGSNPSCNYSVLYSDAPGTKNYWAHIVDDHGMQSDNSPLTGTFEVNPSIAFSLSSNTVGFGNFASTDKRWATASGSGDTSEPSTGDLSYISVSTNAPGGVLVSARSEGSGSTAGLYKPEAPQNLIPALGAGSVSSGSEGYAVYVKDAGGNLTVTSGFDGPASDTAISTSFQTILTASGPLSTNNTAYLALDAAIQASTDAGHYVDTITIVATGKY